LFATIDKNNDGLLEKKELDLILAVTAVGGQENNMAKMVDQIMQEYDVDHDDMLTLDEFLNGLRKWCKELKLHRQSSMKASVSKPDDS
jgi:Ca2+-binding EF-hand superfamily protein